MNNKVIGNTIHEFIQLSVGDYFYFEDDAGLTVYRKIKVRTNNGDVLPINCYQCSSGDTFVTGDNGRVRKVRPRDTCIIFEEVPDE